jgi:hypothetical protein
VFDISVLQGGAAALLAIVILLILTGRLVPASYLKAMREDRDKAVAVANAETARWRRAYEFSEQARRLDAEHSGQLLRTTNTAISAIPTPSAGDPDASAVEA